MRIRNRTFPKIIKNKFTCFKLDIVKVNVLKNH